MSGPCTPERMARLHDESPVRFQACLHDPDESVRRALGLRRLPALVLLNESGYIQTVCAAGDAAARPDELARTMHALAAGSRWARGSFADFRLPRVGGGGLASFLDVAGRDFTLISFLHSGCLPCARELEVLEYLRDRHADGVRLVTIFLDPTRDERILGYLEAAGVRPDAVLRDAELRLALRHQVSAVPALFVVDAAGRIVRARRGYREEARLDLYREIDAVIDTAAGGACPVARDPRRIQAAACAYLREGRPEYALLYLERLREIAPDRHSVHLLVAEAALAAGRRDLARTSYARYLAADPLAYDRGDVRARLATLLEGAR
jgi:tetratricopeptide (TPR) repeat protein